MVPNPYDPLKRTDLNENEKRTFRFMAECLHGDNVGLIDEYVAEDYIQHTPGIGQGKQGLLTNARPWWKTVFTVLVPLAGSISGRSI